MKTGGAWPFENLNIQNFAPNDPKLNSNDLTQKVPTYGDPNTVSPKFSSASPYDQPFSKYSTLIFYDLPSTPMLKFRSARKILKRGRLPRKVHVHCNSLYFINLNKFKYCHREEFQLFTVAVSARQTAD